MKRIPTSTLCLIGSATIPWVSVGSPAQSLALRRPIPLAVGLFWDTDLCLVAGPH